MAQYFVHQQHGKESEDLYKVSKLVLLLTAMAISTSRKLQIPSIDYNIDVNISYYIEGWGLLFQGEAALPKNTWRVSGLRKWLDNVNKCCLDPRCIGPAHVSAHSAAGPEP